MMTRSYIYFVKKPHYREAMMTFAFRNKINWLEEGLTLLSWKYQKVDENDTVDADKLYDHYKKWAGNEKTRTAGHNTISIGDIVVIGDNVHIVLGTNWALVPQVIWRKIIKDEL